MAVESEIWFKKEENKQTRGERAARRGAMMISCLALFTNRRERERANKQTSTQ
jgi:hypothetical protein